MVNRLKISFLFIFSAFLVFNYAGVSSVFAQSDVKTEAQKQKEAIDKVKVEAREKLVVMPTTNPQKLIGQAIQILMMFMGSIMFALVVYSGLIWMTAQGNTEKIEQAKNIMTWATLGVAVMLVSYIVVNFVFNSLEKSA